MIALEPFGVVRCSRLDVVDDFWGGVEAVIELNSDAGRQPRRLRRA